MADSPPIRIAVISDNPDPNWGWIRDLLSKDFRSSGRQLEWHSFSTAPGRIADAGLTAKILRRLPGFGRYLGAGALARAAQSRAFDIIVSHGPWTTAWTAALLGDAKKDARHLAFSFNFTDLPTGLRRQLMTRAFKLVDAFAVFTNAEQALYADYFHLLPEKILRAPWGVAPPLNAIPPRQIEGPYVAALGGEARDYDTLCATARLCPETRFVAIARPHNFDGLAPPANLDVHFNLPFDKAWAIVGHADAAIIPLRSRETPCGLVTLVGTMHLGKAQIVNEAAGVSEYIRDGKTGLLTLPGDAEAMAAALRQLQQDEALRRRLGDAARAYAADHCSEAATVAFFTNFLGR